MNRVKVKKDQLSAVLLAAGKGVRMKSARPKVLSSVCGRTLLDTAINTILEIGLVKEIIVVLNKDLLKLAKTLKAKSKKIKVVVQFKPLGTADAVKVALKAVDKNSADIFISSADAVLVTKSTIHKLICSHLESGRSATLLSAFCDSPEGYGRIIRSKAGSIERITEEADLGEEEKEIREINSGVYCFKRLCLQRALKDIQIRKNKKEYYLTDAVALLLAQGVNAVAADSADEVLGINSAFDLARVQKIMSSRIIASKLTQGIKILDPQTTYIEAGVEIGRDTVIYPFTYIEAGVEIGRGCSIGPFARLRRGVKLGNNVTVGNFVELSRARVGNKSVVKHFSYLGDALVGKAVNIGAGSVTANYDGKDKHITDIEDGAFIGCDTVLVAPVKIGKRSRTGAGAVVTKNKNVPAGKLAIGVPAKIIDKKIK
jgi:bifunctional UDP-N-acetylglucosamine pyrophosphorylase/glucosamine-1-phosphate N-acetyltransferase